MAANAPASDLDKAFEAFDAGQLETALEAAEAALEAAPGDRDAWLLKATCLDALGQAEAALREYESLTSQFADDAEIWLRLGDLALHGLGDPEMALDVLTTALEVATSEETPDEEMAFEAHLRLVEVHLDLDELDEALSHADAARKLDRDSADAEATYGTVLFEMGRIADAAKAASLAIDKDGKNPSGFHLRGLCLERAKDPGAEKAFAKARSLDPSSVPPVLKLNAKELLAIYKDIQPDLPPKAAEWLKDVKVSVEELPPDNELVPNGGTLRPSALVAVRGKPLSEEGGSDKPDGVVLYRSNLCRGAEETDDVAETLGNALVFEILAFLDADPADFGMAEDG